MCVFVCVCLFVCGCLCIYVVFMRVYLCVCFRVCGYVCVCGPYFVFFHSSKTLASLVHAVRSCVVCLMQKICRRFCSSLNVPTVLETRVPKELKRVVVRSSVLVEPGEMWRRYSDMLVGGDPGAIMHAVRMYMKAEDVVDVRFLIQAISELGLTFDFNSFWGSSDKQHTTQSLYFKYMIADLCECEIPVESLPVLFYSLACLEYRPPKRFSDKLLVQVEKNIHEWTLPVLSNLAFSLSMLNVDGGDTVEKLVGESHTRFGKYAETGDLHDWSQLAFVCVLKNIHHTEMCATFLTNSIEKIRSKSSLDRSGWAQFFIYQTLYCSDVEGGSISNYVPQWIQEHLHHRWKEGKILTVCQPQGADLLQLDVDSVLKRTKTNAVLNCSAGRDSDEYHCWFVGHKLNPKIAIEYNSLLGTRPSGWVALKTRILQACGYTVIVINRDSWKNLDDKQKDEQIMFLRNKLGYDHSINTTVKKPNPAIPRKKSTGETSSKPGFVKWEDQPDWEPHLREPELHFTVHGYKPKDNPNFKGGVQVNKRRRYIANGNHNWVNSLSPKG